jgi:hypothetical protein
LPTNSIVMSYTTSVTYPIVHRLIGHAPEAGSTLPEPRFWKCGV